MALTNSTQSISLTAQSVVGSETICYFTATIESGDPDNVQFGRNIVTGSTYRDNRAQCATDQSAFEDAVYSVVDQLKAKATATSSTGSATA